MKAINKYYIFFSARLGLAANFLLITYLLEIEFMPIIAFIYIILRSLYFLFIYHDYTINTSNIVILPNKVFNSKEEEYDFKEIEKIIFIDKYWIFYGIQKIQIVLSNGQKIMIDCDGIKAEDEYEWVDSFDKQYEYTKSVFNNVYRKDSTLCFGKKSS
jgi:hypothetical protein